MKQRGILFATAFVTVVAVADPLPSRPVELPILSREQQMANDAAEAAVRYVVAPPIVESNSAVSERVRSITINDRGRRCVVEVTYNGAMDQKAESGSQLPSGWLVSKLGCSPALASR